VISFVYTLRVISILLIAFNGMKIIETELKYDVNNTHILILLYNIYKRCETFKYTLQNKS